MYLCQKCNFHSKPREKQFKKIVKSRHRVYYDKLERFQGEGKEIVKEINICTSCKEKELKKDEFRR